MKIIFIISIFIIIFKCKADDDINPKCESNTRNVTLKDDANPTMLFFMIGFKNPQSEKTAKAYYLIQQVHCSIPNVTGLDYGLVFYPSRGIQSVESSNFESTLLKMKNKINAADCEKFKESFDILESDTFNSYKRVEVIVVIDPEVSCDFHKEFNLDAKFRFNAIRFDSEVIKGTNSLNYPNIDSIKITETSASSELKLVAFNFVGDILGIPRPVTHSPKEGEIENMDKNRIVEYVVIGVIVLGFVVGGIGIFFLIRNSKRNAIKKEAARVADIERRRKLEVEATKKKEAYILRLYGPREKRGHKIDVEDPPSEPDQDPDVKGKMTPKNP